MSTAVGSARFEQCLDAIYDAAVLPDGWSAALSALGTLFDAGFADICSWTPDRLHVSGTAVGLDASDYETQLLGFWFNRNVWGRKSPVRVAGEVISTRQMVPREDLRASEMYHDYLEPRGLHEGMRLSLWVEPDCLADISLLRPWSRGAFGPADIELGRMLLPHLRRGAKLTRQLRRAETRIDLGETGAGTNAVAVVAFDRDGVPIHANAKAEAIFARGTDLWLGADGLRTPSAETTDRLMLAVARAVGRTGAFRAGSSVRLPWTSGATATMVVQPLSRRRDWAMPRPPAAVALFRDPRDRALTVAGVQALFALTAAEAQFALQLASGLTLHEIAAQTGRSRNTIRSHLASVMNKTATTRQVDLVRLLNEVERSGSRHEGRSVREIGLNAWNPAQ